MWLAGRTLLLLAAPNQQLKGAGLQNLAERARCSATAGREVVKAPRACFLQLASFNEKQDEDYLKAVILAGFAGECELSHLQQIRYSGSSIFNCRQKKYQFYFVSPKYQLNTSVWPQIRLYKAPPSGKQHKIINQHYI